VKTACFVLLAAGIGGASEAPAQQAATHALREANLGSRVRILAPSMRTERYVGRIDSLDANAIVLDTALARRRLGFDTGPVLVDEYRRIRIQMAAIEGVEVSGGQTRRGRTIKGAIFGSIGGALLIGFGQLPEVNPKAKDFLKGAPVGAVVGAVVGGIVGYALGTERWLPAVLPR
jgi:hypothetical protein